MGLHCFSVPIGDLFGGFLKMIFMLDVRFFHQYPYPATRIEDVLRLPRSWLILLNRG